MPVMPRRRWPRTKQARSMSATRSSRASRTRSSGNALAPLANRAPGGQAAPMDAVPVEEMSFEQALAELESIVRTLEQGSAPLDESIELYQRGDKLKRHCEARLKAAQMRIEQIALGPDGAPAGTKPFDVD